MISEWTHWDTLGLPLGSWGGGGPVGLAEVEFIGIAAKQVAIHVSLRARITQRIAGQPTSKLAGNHQ